MKGEEIMLDMEEIKTEERVSELIEYLSATKFQNTEHLISNMREKLSSLESEINIGAEAQNLVESILDEEFDQITTSGSDSNISIADR